MKLNEHPHFQAAWQGRRNPSYRFALLYTLYLWLSTNLVVLVLVLVVALAFLLAAGAIESSQRLVDGGLAGRLRALLTGSEALLAINFAAFTCFIFFTWLWLRFVDGRPFSTLGMRRTGMAGRWLGGAGFGAGQMAVVALLFAASGWGRLEPISLDRLRLLWPMLYALFYLVQGAAEEVQVRGYLLQVLGARGGAVVGIGVSSLIFALQHLLNPNLMPLAVLNLFLAGIFASILVLASGDLWAAFGWHSAWNWVQGYVWGLPISGLAPEGALLPLQVEGPALLTGGAFGPEGGLIVTLVLLASTAVVGWRLARSAVPHRET